MDAVLTVGDLEPADLTSLLARFGLDLEVLDDASTITGSYWGDSEAGIAGTTVYVRTDTPLHSLLHEACPRVCMDSGRRAAVDTDAGGDDLEEAAVCYLQVLLADELAGVGRDRLMRDMDAWGYSFRLGSTARWFHDDAEDARDWLERQGLLEAGRPAFRLRARSGGV